VHLSSESALRGQPLMNWLGLADQPLAALVAKVRRDGIARHIESWVRRGAAPATPIEISAALLTEGDQECIGFTIRPTARLPAPPALDAADGDALSLVLRAGIAALTEQFGEHVLAGIVRDLAERLGVSPDSLTGHVRHGAGALTNANPGTSAS